jgi:hypothetical protein
LKAETISLKNESERIWGKIAAGENISLLRYTGDVSSILILGEQDSKNVSKLREDLFTSLSLNDDKVYYGIPCFCCDCSMYYWFKTRITNSNVTFANLWTNASYKNFIESFEKINREAVVISNFKEEKPIGNLKILKHYRISSDSSDFWEMYGAELLINIKKNYGNKKNLLFVVCAGFLSEPIIAELFRNNPDNCYIDFGSSLDKYQKDKETDEHKYNPVYAKRNCRMYNPKTIDFNVSVILTLYKRPDKLLEQLNAIENQTLKPKEILLFHDAANPPIEFEYNNELKSRITNYIKVDKNIGVWGRFAGGLLAKSKYVCFFDDDTIPGKRWLENCHTQIIAKQGLYGTIGIDSWNLKNYPFRSYRRWGWDGNCSNSKEVDFVGHSWFLKKDWLGVMWINYSQFYAFKYVAEDAFLSYSLKKWLKIKTYVPPHPKNDMELFGSIPEKALRYGQETGKAINLNPENIQAMNQALKLLVREGFKSKNLRLSNIIGENNCKVNIIEYILNYSKEYFSDLIKEYFLPINSKRRNFYLKIRQFIE